jgi:hypothetical protein
MRHEAEYRKIPNVMNEDDDANEPSFLQQVLHEAQHISELEPKPLFKNIIISQSPQLLKKMKLHSYKMMQ